MWQQTVLAPKEAQLANKEVFDFITYWDVHRHDLPYETDGVVVA
jgi:DNA ligase (NAD+)